MAKNSLRMVFLSTVIGLMILGWLPASASVFKPSNGMIPAFVPAAPQAGVVSFIPHYRFRPTAMARDRFSSRYRPFSYPGVVYRNQGSIVPRQAQRPFFKPTHLGQERFRPLQRPRAPSYAPYPKPASGGKAMGIPRGTRVGTGPLDTGYAGRLAKPWLSPDRYLRYPTIRPGAGYPPILPVRPVSMPWSVTRIKPGRNPPPPRYAAGQYRFRPQRQARRYAGFQPRTQPVRGGRVAAAPTFRFGSVPMPAYPVPAWHGGSGIHPLMAQQSLRPWLAPPSGYRFRPDPRLQAAVVYPRPIGQVWWPGMDRSHRQPQSLGYRWRPLGDRLVHEPGNSPELMEQQSSYLSAFPEGVQLAN